MTLELFGRRKRMLELHYAGLNPAKIVETVAQKYDVNKKTVERDWNRRDTWEKLIWAAVDAKTDFKKLLNYLTLAEEAAYNLSKTATPDFAKVGALKTLIETVARHIELQQSLGILHKEPERLEIEQKALYVSVAKVLIEVVKKDNPKLVPIIYEALEKCQLEAQTETP